MGEKAFLKLGGKTLLECSLEAFNFADEIIIALPQGLLPKSSEKVRYVHGGATRRASVFAMLAVASGEIVLVHDVARPFIVREAVDRLIDAVKESGAATLAISVPDTLVQDDDGTFGELRDRSQHRLVQTPQGFKRELLLEAHENAEGEATDDAQMVKSLGHPVALVEGDRRMFKITFPEDWIIARAMAGEHD